MRQSRAAYSRLKFLLDERRMTRAELQRRIAAEEHVINVKTLYRLADPDRPLERIDLRTAGAVCRALGVGLGDLVIFAEPAAATLRTLPDSQQRRLDALMQRHNEGQLGPSEVEELRRLVEEAEEIARSNARRLAEHRRLLRKSTAPRRPAAAG
jgi:DNA-binding Xre family transcriptional regulator